MSLYNSTHWCSRSTLFSWCSSTNLPPRLLPYTSPSPIPRTTRAVIPSSFVWLKHVSSPLLPPLPPFFNRPPSHQRSSDYRTYIMYWCIRQLSEFVHNKNPFDCFRATLMKTTGWPWYKLVLKVVTDRYNLWGHTPRYHTRLEFHTHTACTDEFRRNLRFHSLRVQSVFFKYTTYT